VPYAPTPWLTYSNLTNISLVLEDIASDASSFVPWIHVDWRSLTQSSSTNGKSSSPWTFSLSTETWETLSVENTRKGTGVPPPSVYPLPLSHVLLIQQCNCRFLINSFCYQHTSRSSSWFLSIISQRSFALPSVIPARQGIFPPICFVASFIESLELEGTFKGHLVQLRCNERPSGCSEPAPAWPWKPPGARTISCWLQLISTLRGL